LEKETLEASDKKEFHWKMEQPKKEKLPTDRHYVIRRINSISVALGAVLSIFYMSIMSFFLHGGTYSLYMPAGEEAVFCVTAGGHDVPGIRKHLIIIMLDDVERLIVNNNLESRRNV
jgi:hypothetical protein